MSCFKAQFNCLVFVIIKKAGEPFGDNDPSASDVYVVIIKTYVPWWTMAWHDIFHSTTFYSILGQLYHAKPPKTHSGLWKPGFFLKKKKNIARVHVHLLIWGKKRETHCYVSLICQLMLPLAAFWHVASKNICKCISHLVQRPRLTNTDARHKYCKSTKNLIN